MSYRCLNIPVKVQFSTEIFKFENLQKPCSGFSCSLHSPAGAEQVLLVLYSFSFITQSILSHPLPQQSLPCWEHIGYQEKHQHLPLYIQNRMIHPSPDILPGNVVFISLYRFFTLTFSNSSGFTSSSINASSRSFLKC